ncbi:MAG: BamA/TamA family outer membrane protein [Muribaculaceae bacterium]|nr:BamA/TamA family outer membrane protein [Muribaculaceae bacterium]
MRHRISVIFELIFSVVSAFALDNGKPIANDSVKPKLNLYQRVIRYFEQSNQVKPQKDFDISFIGGPHYSSDSKFGIGLVAAGVYRHDKTDTITQPSNVSIYFDATTTMHFRLGVCGTHFYTNDKRRWSYDVNFASINTKFWGIGYDNAINDDNESDYKYLSSRAETEFVWRVARNFYAGPIAAFDYINGRDFEKPWLWNDEADRTFNVGVGLTLQYDTRDNITCTTHGTFLKAEQMFNPHFLANKYSFALTELTASSFHPLWRGAILATNLHSRLTYGNTPWGLLSIIGSSHSMRGYFEGRYRDKCELDACVELRQHVWHRNGVAAWIGAGSIFPKFSALRWRKILPNYGIGYRWEFKHFMNVRLDLGFGRHQTGFIFSINEAF